MSDLLSDREMSDLRARWKFNQTNETNWNRNGRQPVCDRRRRYRRLPTTVGNNAARYSLAANVRNRRSVRIEVRAALRAGHSDRRLKKQRADRDDKGEPAEHTESLA